MEVLLLGTGSADGWPNPWCSAPCCADRLAAGEIRTPTSALVDRTVLIDPGPEAARQAVRSGVSLAQVSDVLITHAHHDHLDAAFLMHRTWGDNPPLRVVGPHPVIDECRRWLAPDQRTVRLVPVTAGSRLSLGDYQVRVLPAAHQALGEACLYLVHAPGATLLWATDTGPWPPGTPQLLAGTHLGLVCLEETFGDRDDLAGQHHHHSLRTFAAAVAQLRDWGCLTAATEVIAVHLSHHNPAPEVLRQRLRRVGARIEDDGARIMIGGPGFPGSSLA